MNIKFSIIMPCYNSQAYISGALDSLASQTYPNWELIAVNDGSTDTTLRILQEYARKDLRIKILSKENGGYVSAVNTGLEYITGDYFLLLGSDDALSPDLFTSLVTHLDGRLPDCMAWRTILMKNGYPQGLDRYTQFNDSISVFDSSFAQYSREYPHYAAILSTRDTSKCFKRSLLEELRYYGRYGIDADGIFSMLFCHKARSFAAVPVDGYLWTLRDDSLSARKRPSVQNFDRVENWIRFYTYLSTLDTEAVTPQEYSYLPYFLGTIAAAWISSQPFFNRYPLIKQALKLYISFTKKMRHAPQISAGQKLLFHFPVTWKALHKIPIKKFKYE